MHGAEHINLFHERNLTEAFKAGSGVRKVAFCLTLILTVKECIMKRATQNKNGVRCCLNETFEDLANANNVSLISHSYKDMSKKIYSLQGEAATAGPKSGF